MPPTWEGSPEPSRTSISVTLRAGRKEMAASIESSAEDRVAADPDRPLSSSAVRHSRGNQNSLIGCMFDRHAIGTNQLYVPHGSKSLRLSLGHDSACDIPTGPMYEPSQPPLQHCVLFESLRFSPSKDRCDGKAFVKMTLWQRGVAQE